MTADGNTYMANDPHSNYCRSRRSDYMSNLVAPDGIDWRGGAGNSREFLSAQ